MWLGNMCTKVALVIALVWVLGTISPSFAQFRAQDQCKDVLINAVFDTKKFYHDEYFKMSHISDEKRETSRTQQQDSSIWVNYLGIPGGLSSSDKSTLRDTLAKHVDLRILFNNRTYALLQTGQKEIIDAWSMCMANHGGGPTVYFTEVEGNPTKVNLHIQNLRGNGFRGADLTVARTVAIDPELGTVETRHECLMEGYPLKWGSECTVSIKTRSGWRADTITVPLKDGDNTHIDFPAYLAPRIKLVSEIKTWPSPQIQAAWVKNKMEPNVTGPNAIKWSYGGKHNDNRSLMYTNANNNCIAAEEGWLFLDGEKRPHKDNKNVSVSDFVHVEAQGPVGLCTVNWHIAPDKKYICIGGVLGSGMNPNPHSCSVSIIATMARFMWQEKALPTPRP